jgi:hypothetical protein
MVSPHRPPVTQSVVVDAAGNATLSFYTRGSGIWRWKQFGVSMPNGGSVVGQMYFNGSPVSPFYNPDTIAGDPPIDAGPGDEVRFTVAGAVPGAVLTIAGFYDPLR